MPQLPTGSITLLFTDIEGSTRLLHQLGNRYAGVLRECRRLLRAAFQQANGVEVDTQGDSFFVVFERAAEFSGGPCAGLFDGPVYRSAIDREIAAGFLGRRRGAANTLTRSGSATTAA